MIMEANPGGRVTLNGNPINIRESHVIFRGFQLVGNSRFVLNPDSPSNGRGGIINIFVGTNTMGNGLAFEYSGPSHLGEADFAFAFVQNYVNVIYSSDRPAKIVR